ncbi:VanZ family protein [Hahella sp. HN01]|uniref:VanZ family protein n=1 Tax=Hahella sp. HN01 TaxID=2847262 RepID=UPI001C1F182A|nr:VanZ family protein [Hahella sp. HN01]MBU6950529.1 VanZ family protein [Hahella sp. HN01]
MQKAVSLFALGFLAFILWIIYLADTGGASIFFDFVQSIPYGDKLGHFCLFGVLTLAANFAFKTKHLKLGPIPLYVGALCVLTFAIGEELTQAFFPSRTLDITDVMADVASIAFFSWVTLLLSANKAAES